MTSPSLGRTLTIANPAAHCGRGAAASDLTRRLFEALGSATSSYEHLLTTAMGDGQRLASQAADYDTVVALGGDGMIHEVANGLMAIPRRERPALAIVPIGSGNDFARTMGVTLDDPEAAVAQIVDGTRRRIDLGRVSSDMGRRVYFVETLSFGLDAAIALDTIDRRAAADRQEGAGLFATSGIKIMGQVRGDASGFPSLVSVDGEPELALNSIVFALQNGPTYGGGFSVCPDAVPDDGMLDVCYNVRTPSMPHLMLLFGLARFGRHVGSSVVSLRRFRELDVRFTEREPPCQVDGERLTGRAFHVEVVPSALEVVVGPGCSW